MTVGELVKVRMLRSYGSYRTGQIVDVTGGLARSLEIAKYAERVKAEPQFRFAVAPEPEVERAEAPVAKARRRRHA